tara:strand:- start:3661 stop:5556 length:1896 start_codon:yes stop_codon:yes gene_type:complete
MKDKINYLSKISKVRRFILSSLDLIILYFSANLSLELFFSGDLISQNEKYMWILNYYPWFGITIFLISGHYKALTRAIGSREIYFLALRTILLVLSISFLGFFTKKIIPPFLFWLLIWGISTALIGSAKFILRDLLILLKKKNRQIKASVVIYGAGSAGFQLANSLLIDGNYKIITFLDDDDTLKGRSLKGISIQNPDKFLSSFDQKIDYVLMAIPSLDKKKFNEIVSKLYFKKFNVLKVPSLDELTNGKAQIDSLSPISIYDLLSRNNVSYIKELYGPGIKDYCICVTGAAGSIGYELSLQIAKLGPSKLIMIDHNEYGLYNLKQNLQKDRGINTELIFKLGNVVNQKFIDNIFEKYKVNKVFHAAAYKHVPIVELNAIQGLLNNVYSTNTICKAAKLAKIDNVILVSSDKAVRPTNIMGASKRLSELIIQAFAYEEQKLVNRDNTEFKKTLFSMVRFGNVLNSSGSVVPLFKKQIDSGGPITITHKNVKRYFMTITEAVELLIQTVVLSKGGDLFLLDMGEPVLIRNLAEQMVKLSGLKLKNRDAGIEGDIEIVYSGLRSGEKLYEELLIDSKAEKTKHPLIYFANESFLKAENLFPKLEILFDCLQDDDLDKSLKILKELVPEWEREV